MIKTISILAAALLLGACSQHSTPAPAAAASSPVVASPAVSASAPAPAYVEDPVDVAFDNAPKDASDWTPPAGAWWVRGETTCDPHKTGPGWVHEVRDVDNDSALKSATEHRDGKGLVTSVDIVYSYRTTEAYTIYRSKADCLASPSPKPAPVTGSVAPVAPVGRTWYRAAESQADCYTGGSPASLMRELQGKASDIRLLDSGTWANNVEVTADLNTGGHVDETFYKSEQACQDKLTNDGKYE